MKRITEADLRVGSQVIVRGAFGAGAPETVTVDEIDEKNGRPLIGYGDRWAYLTQIDRIVTY